MATVTTCATGCSFALGALEPPFVGGREGFQPICSTLCRSSCDRAFDTNGACRGGRNRQRSPTAWGRDGGSAVGAPRAGAQGAEGGGWGRGEVTGSWPHCGRPGGGGTIRQVPSAPGTPGCGRGGGRRGAGAGASAARQGTMAVGLASRPWRLREGGPRALSLRRTLAGSPRLPEPMAGAMGGLRRAAGAMATVGRGHGSARRTASRRVMPCVAMGWRRASWRTAVMAARLDVGIRAWCTTSLSGLGWPCQPRAGARTGTWAAPLPVHWGSSCASWTAGVLPVAVGGSVWQCRTRRPLPSGGRASCRPPLAGVSRVRRAGARRPRVALRYRVAAGREPQRGPGGAGVAAGAWHTAVAASTGAPQVWVGDRRLGALEAAVRAALARMAALGRAAERPRRQGLASVFA